MFLDGKYFTHYCTGSEHIAFHNIQTAHFKLEYNHFFQQPFKAQWLLHTPPAFTVKSLHSPHSMNWLVSVIDRMFSVRYILKYKLDEYQNGY